MEELIKFVHAFFSVLANYNLISGLIASSFPASLYLFFKSLDMTETHKYIKYVVCIKCHKLHLHKNSFRKFAGSIDTKSCDNVTSPNHPQKHQRKPCGQPLMYALFTSSGKKVLTPFKVYCYKPIKESLSSLVRYKDFDVKCEQWRERKTVSGVLTDIFDVKS